MMQSETLTTPFQRFFQKFVQGSYPLFAAAVVAIVWVNLSYETYHTIWHTQLSFSLGPLHASKTIAHWIDEALMALFFFAVGLEIKHELLVGELSSVKKAMLPVMAAVGGMIVPAVIYAVFNYDTANARGWGIPMATDIAFSLAVLALLGRRIPFGIKLFLSAFAIADDLGAVIVIAFFYTGAIKWNSLLAGCLFIFGLFLANRLWIRSALVYVVLGMGLWICILNSGVHATVAGVLVAMFIPARGKYDTDAFADAVEILLDKLHCGPASCGYSILVNREHLNAVQAIDLACRDVETPMQRFEHILQPWIAYLILPLFALAHSGIIFKGFDFLRAVSHSVTIGVIVGLVLGKPIGITLFSLIAVDTLSIPLPSGVTKRHVVGASFLGGIGFTMSLFIAGLTFTDPRLMELAKFAIVAASILSGVLGFLVLRGIKPLDPEIGID